MIHESPAYELAVEIEKSAYGNHLRFVSFVPTARRPELQERFRASLTTAELTTLYMAIGHALRDVAVHASRSPDEPPGRDDECVEPVRH